MDTAVLSITRIQSGDAYNVIPQYAVPGRHRAGDEARGDGDGRAEHERLASSDRRRASAPRRRWISGYLFAPVVNDAEQCVAYADAAADVVGEDRVTAGCAAADGVGGFRLHDAAGAGRARASGQWRLAPSVHNDRYDFNDEAIPYGVALLCGDHREEKLPQRLSRRPGGPPRRRRCNGSRCLREAARGLHAPA